MFNIKKKKTSFTKVIYLVTAHSLMTSRKRKGAGGWGSILKKQRDIYTKKIASLPRVVIHRDKLSVTAILISRKRSEKANQEITFILGDVNPSCIGPNAKGCRLIEDDENHKSIQITPDYSWLTSKAYESRMGWLSSRFPITEEDIFELVPGKVYKMYCPIGQIPEKNFCVIQLHDIDISCTVSEPWGGTETKEKEGIDAPEENLEKSFFAKVKGIDVLGYPTGANLLKLLYQCNVMVRDLPDFSERRNDMSSKVKAAEAFSDGNSAYGAQLMNDLWKSDRWQNKYMPKNMDILILQLGSSAYFLGEYFKTHPCGADINGLMFEFTPSGPNSTVHKDDIMQFRTRTSQNDETPIMGWRFVGTAVTAKIKEESLDKEEKDIVDEDIEYVKTHTIKVSMFQEVCRTMGFPSALILYENLMTTYFQYIPFAISCKIDAGGSLKRPENSNEGSAYSVIVDDIVGPLKEFWETIGIPVSKEMACRMVEFSSGESRIVPNKEALPSVIAGTGIACLSDISNTPLIKTIIMSPPEEGKETSLFIVIMKDKSDGILPHIYNCLKDFDVWNEDDIQQGDIVIRSIFEEYELVENDNELDEEDVRENYPKAHNFLKKISYFDADVWEHKRDSFLLPFVYSTDKTKSLTQREKLGVKRFLGIE